jgi:hypothetical protein
MQVIEEDGKLGCAYVIGMWLVKRQGRPFLMMHNDYSLGVFSGSREAFEKRLVRQGYLVLQLLRKESDVEIVKLIYPRLYATSWIPD